MHSLYLLGTLEIYFLAINTCDVRRLIPALGQLKHIIPFVPNINSICNPILFAICTSTFSELCVTYTVAFRRVLSSAPL
jgi:hypothetical protein